MLLGVALVAPLACTFDPDDRCGPNQVPYEDNVRCVCEPGSALTAEGCVPCGENEIAGPSGCVCNIGFFRATPDAACEEAPAGLGAECDTASNPCADAVYNHCEVVAGTSGYCTKTGCALAEECGNGYGCDTAVSPSVCRKPPDGLGQPCSTDADCTGTEATYCDFFVSHSCLVPNCNLAPDNCFAGWECCDLTSFGLPMTLCIPDGGCTT